MRHGDARDRDGAHELERIERALARASGVPSTCTSMLIGTDSGCAGRLASVAIMPTRSSRALAHADDAAAADVDAGVAHMRQRVEAVLIGAGGDDLAVEFRRGVEVVVVIVEAGRLEPLRLVGR